MNAAPTLDKRVERLYAQAIGLTAWEADFLLEVSVLESADNLTERQVEVLAGIERDRLP